MSEWMELAALPTWVWDLVDALVEYEDVHAADTTCIQTVLTESNAWPPASVIDAAAFRREVRQSLPCDGGQPGARRGCGMSGSVHVWGFFDDNGNRRLPDGAAPSDISVYCHHRNVQANIVHFGGDIYDLRVTRTLDGDLVETEFTTKVHHDTAAMWHVITRPSDEWPAPRTPDPHDHAPEHERKTA